MAMVRTDRNDQIYKTKDGKWNAVLKEIAARHENGQGAGGEFRGGPRAGPLSN